ncbi:hypothetical protein P6709_14435 [Jeotgalibacillus sp. ET6]|uniref:hypothetical protein n=1 Tax=Jeotgalibacillus sp. ET6 TaxID=3037260 RepID=UPI00241827F8|nr:hypothetical protein [Jeotgalibacillus sp. ET6]MDG5472948.1 hypothetical protein [Jeotgalibacillus sp. ET6]
MSLSKITLGEAVKKQYKYKLFSYYDAIKSLLIIQLIAIVFSFIGSGGSSTSDMNVTISVDTYSSDVVFFFTVLWMFITAILLTTRAYRYEDFSFITNRISSQLANTLYLLTGAAAGTITTVLSTFLLYVIFYFTNSSETIFGYSAAGSPGELMLAAGGTFFYLLAAAALGYFLGVLTQINRLLGFFAAAILLFLPMFLGQFYIFNQISTFYFQESSLLLFGLKILLSALLLFCAAILLLNKREVRV